MSGLADLPLRPELVGQEPYGAPQLDVAHQLNVNENPYPPNDAIRAEMAEAILKVAAQLNRYPDREARDLRQALAAYLGAGLGPDNIWVANGSNEIMMHLLGAFGGPGRTMLTFGQTYSMYPEYARDSHTGYVAVSRDRDYRITRDLALAAIEAHRPDVIVVTTPNNPTGTLTSLDVIDELCRASDAIVVVDEAYQEFADAPSAIGLLPTHPRLVVSRTMSKAFALAGTRVGYLAASPAVVDACRIVRLPYHLSAQTQALAQVALAHAPEMLAKVAALRDECQSLQSWLREQGYDVIASQANFCLFGTFDDRHAVWRHLLDRGVLVRETGPAGYLRVSAGTPDQMAAFRDALSEWKGN
ncbi:MAG: histidinol-phosphate transaminase [Propionibacteriaceae bacterium]|nr:histidinol-phosphate transaminase [Propionibacteriaceae bacterium]